MTTQIKLTIGQRIAEEMVRQPVCNRITIYHPNDPGRCVVVDQPSVGCTNTAMVMRRYIAEAVDRGIAESKGDTGASEAVPAWAEHWRKTEPKMCPFCGSSARVVASEDTDSRGVPNGNWHAHVGCMTCMCCTSDYGAESEQAARDRALKVWNERKYATREWGDR